MDGEGEIDACGKEDETAAGRGCCVDGAIDGCGVEGFAVAEGAVGADIKDAEFRGRGWCILRGSSGRAGEDWKGAGDAEAADTQEIAAKKVVGSHWGDALLG